jgi:hypothetical protein
LNIVIGTGTIYGDSVGGRTVNLTFRRTDNWIDGYIYDNPYEPIIYAINAGTGTVLVHIHVEVHA